VFSEQVTRPLLQFYNAMTSNDMSIIDEVVMQHLTCPETRCWQWTWARCGHQLCWVLESKPCRQTAESQNRYKRACRNKLLSKKSFLTTTCLLYAREAGLWAHMCPLYTCNGENRCVSDLCDVRLQQKQENPTIVYAKRFALHTACFRQLREIIQ